MAGKEEIVVKGLEATQVKLDEFLSFFDVAVVTRVKNQVQEENELNMKEFDPTLGDIVNMKPIPKDPRLETPVVRDTEGTPAPNEGTPAPNEDKSA